MLYLLSYEGGMTPVDATGAAMVSAGDTPRTHSCHSLTYDLR